MQVTKLWVTETQVEPWEMFMFAWNVVIKLLLKKYLTYAFIPIQHF